MFNLSVFLLTLQNVATLLIFIFIGYTLRHSGKVPKASVRTLSVLTANLFSPAYTINSLSKNFTVEKLGSNLLLLCFSVVLMLAVFVVARLAARFLGKSDFEKKSLTYLFSFPNIAFFGYPVIQGVFGDEVLAQFIVFCIPQTVAIHSYGYALFADGKEKNSKKLFLSPQFMGTFIGCFLGLTGFSLPAFLQKVLDGAGACMSPSSMLLAGLELGAFPILSLLMGAKPYLLGLARLVGIPLLFGIPLYLFGVRDLYLFLPLLMLSLPVGLNLVVYPENFGHDASENADLCFVSFLMSIITLPFLFTVIQTVSGL